MVKHIFLSSLPAGGFRAIRISFARITFTIAAFIIATCAIVIAPATAQETAQETEENQADYVSDEILILGVKRDNIGAQDVPLSAKLLDAELLSDADIQSIVELEQLEVGLQVSQTNSQSTGTAITVRGVGTSSNNLGFEPAVGIVIDGVPRTRLGAGINRLPELAAIEILRGPQGTLFGRNTSAGVINVVTAQPEFDTGSSASFRLGSFEGQEWVMSTTGPISDNAAMRLDVISERRDGYIDDVNTGQSYHDRDEMLVRIQHIWEDGPHETRFIADYSQNNNICCTAVHTLGRTSDLLNGLAEAATPQPLVGVTNSGNANNDTSYDAAFTPGRAFQDDVRDYGVSLEYNQALELGEFTSISAFRSFDTIQSHDLDFSGADILYRDGKHDTQDVFTQEMRLQGVAGQLDWLGGAFLMHQKISSTDTIKYGTQADAYIDILV
ncbi:MAG: TonB-dependent receptor plug domain-containing protein, partial [PS1 clade bacterium]|nr:TonB-dependent receptor plug domain-containing protein [PS1 clade bacterium]